MTDGHGALVAVATGVAGDLPRVLHPVLAAGAPASLATLPDDCDHIDIDTRTKRCRDCGTPLSDEACDAFDERRAGCYR